MDVNVHLNCSHWIAGPSYQPETDEKRTLQEIFYKECCSNNWFRNTLCHYYYYCYWSAGACISALTCMLLRWSVDFLFYYYFYLQLSQFSLKPAVMVSGVIGSIPWGHSPASSGQTNSGTVTAKLRVIKHWSQWTLAFTRFLFLLLFSMRTLLASHIHSALLYRREQILKPLFKTFCYLLHWLHYYGFLFVCFCIIL